MRGRGSGHKECQKDGMWKDFGEENKTEEGGKMAELEIGHVFLQIGLVADLRLFFCLPNDFLFFLCLSIVLACFGL